jgi:hypothetical protein
VLGDLGGRDLDEVIPNVVAFLVAFVGGSWRPRSVCVGDLGKSHLGNQRSLPLFIVSSMQVHKGNDYHMSQLTTDAYIAVSLVSNVICVTINSCGSMLLGLCFVLFIYFMTGA